MPLTLITITAIATGPGTISPIGDASLSPGDNQSYTITAASEAVIHDILVDGVSVGTTSPYAFTNVQADHTIEAQFIADTSSPTRDFINAIADGLVIAMKTITHANGYVNDFASAQIERAPTMLDWTTVKRPYLGVAFEEITRQVQYGSGSNSQWGVEGSFAIRFIIAMNGASVGRAAPERMAATYAQDIMRAIALNANLYGILDTGVAQPGPVLVAQDPEMGAMAAYGVVTVSASWVWHP